MAVARQLRLERAGGIWALLSKNADVRFVALRLVLGTVLLAAGTLKARAVIDAWAVGETRVPQLVSTSIVVGELIIALLLLCGIRPKIAWYSAVTTFGLFACYSVVLALRGSATCGCFGTVRISPWLTLGLDVTAVAALATCQPEGYGMAAVHRRTTRWLRLALVCTVAASTIWLSFAGGTEASAAVVDPEQWLGKALPLLSYIDINDEISKGEWTVIFFRHDCPSCQRAIARLEGESRRTDRTASAIRRIALIEVPPFGSKLYGNAFFCRIGRLDDRRNWLIETPLYLELSDSLVHSVGRGESGSDPVVISESF
jgi:hypothetical protein